MPITDRGRRVVQGQRAGLLPADHADMFPGLSWKQPGYTNICQGYLTGATVDAADAAEVDWANFPGYFEAGSACPHALPLHTGNTPSSHTDPIAPQALLHKVVNLHTDPIAPQALLYKVVNLHPP